MAPDLDGEPHRHPRWFHGVGALIWCALIAVPPVNAISSGGSTLRVVVRLLGALAFVGAALLMICNRSDRWPRRVLRPSVGVAAFATMIAIAAAMNVSGHGEWVYLFSYCAGFASLLPVRGWIYPAAGLAVVGAALASWLCGEDGGGVVSNTLSAAGVALVLVLVRDLGERVRELRAARSELAQLAVSAERERFARDLHDLLGHSLTLIAIKAELAGRLIESEPSRAAQEIADIEGAARASLAEVREAVGGYRQPDLEAELDAASASLRAAGFACEVELDECAFAPEIASVLAWTVREGTTNVIRHSNGRQCRINVGRSCGVVVAEISDDGSATQTPDRQDAGHGIEGLSERVQAVGGTMRAAAGAGGFRLTVEVPGSQDVSAAAAPARSRRVPRIFSGGLRT